jgi:glycosyltransferase involved in cell wall biosynthesis
VVHLITPGDHYSPLTGSATSTVVNGLAGAAARTTPNMPQFVVVDAATYRPRYETADALEFAGNAPVSRRERVADIARGASGRARRAEVEYFGPAIEVVLRRPPSIVIAHNAPIVPWLLRESPHRVVLYAHNRLLRTFTRAEAARVLDGAAAIVCVSDSLADRMRSDLPKRLGERVHTVGNGVDAAQFRPAETEIRAPSPERPLRVMFVGRMVREKGADVLVKAANSLARSDLEFVFVGSEGFDRNAPLSRHEEQLRRLVAEGSARIVFEPFVDRRALPGLMRTADMLVVPSRWPEPSGLTVGEGMATGLPVVASRIGGIPEVLGKAGRYVEPEDFRSLAAAIARLADDASLRARIGEAARERAVQHDWSWSWANLSDVLRGL